MEWTRSAPTVLAAFLSSLVECVEALTVVLAVGAVRGWRDALAGAGAALLVLTALVAVLGPALAALPLGPIRLALGVLVLLFGMRWLRKAVRRSAGVEPLRDEDAAFARQTDALRRAGASGREGGWDWVAFATAFNITLVEGVEVVFIVIGLGAGGGLLATAGLGAACAALLVAALGFLLHRPLSMVPENMLKFATGVLLCAFGTFWVGEGIGLAWPAQDWSIPALALGFLLAAVLAAMAGRRAVRR